MATTRGKKVQEKNITPKVAAARLLLAHLEHFEGTEAEDGTGLSAKEVLGDWKITENRAEKVMAAAEKLTAKFMERLQKIAGAY